MNNYFRVNLQGDLYLTRYIGDDGQAQVIVEQANPDDLSGKVIGNKLGVISDDQAQCLLELLSRQFPRETASNLTKVEYFAARAPAEPQAWFKPFMPPKPAVRTQNSFRNCSNLPTSVKEELELFFNADCDLESPEAKAWSAAYKQELYVQAEWEAEYKKQRVIQWPFAWASAVLAQRKAPSIKAKLLSLALALDDKGFVMEGDRVREIYDEL